MCPCANTIRRVSADPLLSLLIRSSPYRMAMRPGISHYGGVRKRMSERTGIIDFPHQIYQLTYKRDKAAYFRLWSTLTVPNVWPTRRKRTLIRTTLSETYDFFLRCVASIPPVLDPIVFVIRRPDPAHNETDARQSLDPKPGG